MHKTIPLASGVEKDLGYTFSPLFLKRLRSDLSDLVDRDMVMDIEEIEELLFLLWKERYIDARECL
jgi:hypothetical protein